MSNYIAQVIKSRTFGYILLTIVLLAGFGVRLYKINSPVADWHSWRQADTASVSRIYAVDGINLLYPKYYDISSIQSGIDNPNGYRFVEFPFYNALNVVLFNTFPGISLEVWARLITVVSAVITAFFLFLIGRKYLGFWGGVLSSFFYLFIPFNIYFTRVILPDPFGTMLVVSGLWFFIKYIDNEKIINFLASSLLIAAALLIKPYFIFFLTPIAYLLINKYGIKAIIKNKAVYTRIFIYAAIILVPFFVWRAWEGKFPEGIPFFHWAFNGDGIRFRPAFWRWIFGERLGHLILGIWGLIPFIFGIIRPKMKNSFIQYYALGGLIYVITVATANVRHDYYQIITMPVISLVLASGFMYLWDNPVFNKFLSRVLAVFSVFMMLMTGWLLVKDNYNVNHPEIIDAGTEIDKITPKDAVVIAPYNGDTAFLYQTKRFGWPAIEDSIDNIIERGADYYVSVDLGSSDTKMISARFETIKKTDRYIIIDLHRPIKK